MTYILANINEQLHGWAFTLRKIVWQLIRVEVVLYYSFFCSLSVKGILQPTFAKVIVKVARFSVDHIV